MGKIGSIILIGIYGLALLRPLAPFLEYELNKDYIQEFLCINKNKSEEITVCYGKCYLAIQLEKSSEHSSESNKPISINLDDYPIGISNLIEFKSILVNEYTSNDSRYLNGYHHMHVVDIFHPPSLV